MKEDVDVSDKNGNDRIHLEIGIDIDRKSFLDAVYRAKRSSRMDARSKESLAIFLDAACARAACSGGEEASVSLDDEDVHPPLPRWHDVSLPQFDSRKAARYFAFGIVSILAIFGLFSLGSLFFMKSPSHQISAAQAQLQPGRNDIPGFSAPGTQPAMQPAMQPVSPGVQQQQSVTADAHPDEDLVVHMGASHADKARTLYVFTDPHCPFCMRIEPVIEKLASEGYEVTIFPTPIKGAESERIVRGIACSKDKLAAWRDGIGDQHLSAPDSCAAADSAVSRAIGLFTAYGFGGTPTLISGDGRVHMGAMDYDALKQWLAEPPIPQVSR